MQPRHPFEQELAGFPDRETALRQVTRYRIYRIMFYRTNLSTHSRRLSWHLRAAQPILTEIYGDQFNADRAIALALVHDDHEIILGDVQLANKDRMSINQLDNLHQAELRAIDKTARLYPENLGRYNYRDLLLDKLEMKSLEAQIVTYFDKYEGFCEALHEIYGGNTCFATPAVNHLGVARLPYEIYLPTLSQFGYKYPATAPMFTADWVFHIPPTPVDWNAIVADGTLHTKTSLLAETGYPYYDYWKRTLLDYADEEEVVNLVLQSEFPAN